MTEPLVIDLFSCAGGAGMGYRRAGLRVIGADLSPQPRYPFTFVQGDALELLPDLVRRYRPALVHASPPCQKDCPTTLGTNAKLGREYPDLYEPIRDLLISLGVPAVIENPASRPDMVLCGEMFGLGVLRHRKFELIGWSADAPAHKPHRGRVRGWRHGKFYDGPYVAAYGRGGGKASVAEMQAAMGIDWTDRHEELREAIPPAYTKWIGSQFLASVALAA